MKNYDETLSTFDDYAMSDDFTIIDSPTGDAREKTKILLLENISDAAIAEFKRRGYESITRVSGALGEAELSRAIRDAHVLGIRSKTQITGRLLAAAENLRAIGCYCIGTDQVDLRAATEKGVAVFNAPHANTRSVAELVIGLCVVLLRGVAVKNQAAHQGVWLKDATGAFELRGKTLGIIGYGNIGSQVSVMAEAMGLNVIYYDIAERLARGNAQQMNSLPELLRQSHIVTLHVPATPMTKNMMNRETFGYLREGAIFLNYSRGDVVDLDALKMFIENGRVAGAAIDVFPAEPERNGDEFVSVLQNLPNVILTPHIGGSTEEAQANIGRSVTAKLVNYLENGSADDSLAAAAPIAKTAENAFVYQQTSVAALARQIDLAG